MKNIIFRREGGTVTSPNYPPDDTSSGGTRGGGTVYSPNDPPNDSGSGGTRGGGIISSPEASKAVTNGSAPEASQQGSSLIKILVFIFILALLGFAAWWAWKKI